MGERPSVLDVQILLDPALNCNAAELMLSPTNRVLKVRAGSAAARAGLRAMDVIIDVDGVPCRTPQQTRALLRAEPKQSSTRRFIRVLRPEQGPVAPVHEVLDAISPTSWLATEEAMAALSDRIWNGIHLRQSDSPLTAHAETAPGEEGDRYIYEGGAGDALLYNGHRLGMGLEEGDYEEFGCQVAHSETEYAPVTRGAVAAVLMAVQSALLVVCTVSSLTAPTAY